jgi:hypothetical protein
LSLAFGSVWFSNLVLQACAKIALQNAKRNFRNVSIFIIQSSDKDFCEFRPLRQNLWLQNRHQKQTFFFKTCNYSYSHLTFIIVVKICVIFCYFQNTLFNVSYN